MNTKIKKNSKGILKMMVFGYFVFIITLSCEKPGHITGRVTHPDSLEPISGVSVGLYKFLKEGYPNNLNDYYWSDFKPIAEAQTDTSGKFILEVDADLDVNSMLMFLMPTKDTTDKEFKYYSTDNEYTYGRYGTNSFSPRPAGKIYIHISNIIQGDTIVLKNKYFTDLLDVTNYYNEVFVEPGMYHTFDFYKRVEGQDVFIESREFYVKCYPTEETGKLIKEIPLQQIDVELINY